MKIAILGTENSHAYAFAKLIKTDAAYSDIEIVGAYGYDANANQKLLDEGLVTRFADKPDAFVNEVDGILCTARHGDHHYEYALPYVKAGKAAFIDKPFTVKEEYTDALINAAKESGALLCGGSSLKFFPGLEEVNAFVKENTIIGGYVGAPINMVNDYAGFYFYSQHLVELMFGAFGNDVKAVTAYCPDQSINRLSVIFDYGAFDVMGQYTSSYAYNVTAFAAKECKTRYSTSLDGCYQKELNEFIEMARTGKMPHSFEELRKPVALLWAIEKSFKTGTKVELN